MGSKLKKDGYAVSIHKMLCNFGTNISNVPLRKISSSQQSPIEMVSPNTKIQRLQKQGEE